MPSARYIWKYCGNTLKYAFGEIVKKYLKDIYSRY